MAKILASSVLALVALSIPAQAQRGDKCAGGWIGKQCAIEMGAYCDPATGQIMRRMGGGTIRGGERWQACVDRKRAELRQRKS